VKKAKELFFNFEGRIDRTQVSSFDSVYWYYSCNCNLFYPGTPKQNRFGPVPGNVENHKD